ncbi:hypothetical protein [Staphylococcus argensis]|uniref:Uncharacterized protein n=1 Tax=Staphylococcus argensis TaxID=1607738 RepID=A0A2K4FDN6_9STAP|nr:hypothetical protein [Staphylococcus argensis]MCY6991308.1 hypothetical protein [Staphylococcus argensis]POA09386.1 hypothetical protein CD039_01095 [Staphylococcus argensis]
MIIIWLLCAVLIAGLTYYVIKRYQRHLSFVMQQLIIVVMLVLESVVIYYLVKEIVKFIVRGLGLFYHE